MRQFTLLGVKLNPSSQTLVLEQIKKYISNPQGSLQIVSLNPENLVVATENTEFKEVIETSKIQIIDGAWAALAGKLFGKSWERFTGVDLMEELVKLADKLSLRVLLIGGRPNLAMNLSNCYSDAYAQAKFKGIEGIRNIKNPLKIEEESIFSIVADYKPHIVMVSFGSPEQELWLDRHKSKFAKILCMGVGGAFDFAVGTVPRAPQVFRKAGLEWFFRLVVEPWRWRRQLRLIKFVFLVLIQKITAFK